MLHLLIVDVSQNIIQQVLYQKCDSTIKRQFSRNYDGAIAKANKMNEGKLILKRLSYI